MSVSLLPVFSSLGTFVTLGTASAAPLSEARAGVSAAWVDSMVGAGPEAGTSDPPIVGAVWSCTAAGASDMAFAWLCVDLNVVEMKSSVDCVRGSSNVYLPTVVDGFLEKEIAGGVADQRSFQRRYAMTIT